MNTWIRGRSAPLMASQALSTSSGTHRARDAILGPPYLCRYLAHSLEVPGRAGGEPGLDHVDAEPVELPGYLQLLLGREPNPGGLLAVPKRCVEYDDSVVCDHGQSPPGNLNPSDGGATLGATHSA